MPAFVRRFCKGWTELKLVRLQVGRKVWFLRCCISDGCGSGCGCSGQVAAHKRSTDPTFPIHAVAAATNGHEILLSIRKQSNNRGPILMLHGGAPEARSTSARAQQAQREAPPLAVHASQFFRPSCDAVAQHRRL